MNSIRIPSFAGGVSRVAQSLRPANMLQEADNVILSLTRGVEKRAGSEFLAGENPDGSLDVTEPTQAKHFHWIDRKEGNQQFLVMIDPEEETDTIEIFNLDGEKQVVNYAAAGLDPRPYLTEMNGGDDPRERLRTISIADTTLVLNKNKVTALTGDHVVYKSVDDAKVHNKSHPHNKKSWAKFDQPPTGTYDPNTTPFVDDNIWYARDAALGMPDGFYVAISTDEPPWYQRVRTEQANSLIQKITMPIRIDFDGSEFDTSTCVWTPRESGDSALNPGPSFIGKKLSDIAYHEGRLFFSSREQIIGSQTHDAFDLWQESILLQVDSDPLDFRLGLNKICDITHLYPFRETLVIMTAAGQQFELRGNGPLSPSSASLFPTTGVETSDQVNPIALGNQLYFVGQRDQYHTIWEYLIQPDQVSNVAQNISMLSEGYIPVDASMLESSEAHDMIFVLTDGAPNAIYVYKTTFVNGDRTISAWFRWVRDEDDEILTIRAFGDWLYMVIRREDNLYLERMPIEQPDNEVVDGEVLPYAVRLDRKFMVESGAYEEIGDETTWTLPIEDDTITNVVLGPEFDALAGTFVVATASRGSGETVLVVAGDYSGFPVIVGRPYEMDIQLSQQYMRNVDGNTVNGTVQLLTTTIRHKAAKFYEVKVTPYKRETFIHEFNAPVVGNPDFNNLLLEADGEFRCRVLGAAHNTEIHITNDSPYPCTLVDMEFAVRFIPLRGNIVK